MTPRAVGPARTPQATTSGRRLSMVLIGLAVATRLARDTRTHATVIVVVIAAAELRRTLKAAKPKDAKAHAVTRRALPDSAT